MEEAWQEAERRLNYLERGLDWQLNGNVREEFLHYYTEFIYESEKESLKVAITKEAQLLFFQKNDSFREKVKLLIGEENTFALLGTDEEIRLLKEESFS